MRKFRHIFTTALMALTLLAWSNVGWGQTTINFDTEDNWIQDGTASFTTYANHGYSESGVTFQGTNVLRNGTAEQDSFPGALGTYSFRLRNVATSKLLITVTTGGVGEFSFKVRRWDDSPMPNYTVKYSTNGTDWTSLSNIDGNLLTTSDWFTYAETINEEVDNVLVEIQNTGTTERIMVDDFFWTGYSAGPDTEAPVPTFFPEHGATGVAVDVHPTITFNEPIYTSPGGVLVDDTNVEDLITFTDGTDAVAFSATISGNVITVVPNAALVNEQAYTLTIDIVQDEAGNAMDAPASATFTTIAADAETIELTGDYTGPYYAGDEVTVTWNAANIDSVVVEAWVPSQNNWVTMVASTPADDGTAMFTIPTDAEYSAEYKLRVADAADGDPAAETDSITVRAVVADIASARALAEGDEFRFDGEAIVTAMNSYKNRKFIEDATAAILIYDDEGKITTTYAVGDGMSGLIGKKTVVDQMVRLVPLDDPGTPVEASFTIESTVFTLDAVTSDDQAKLVTFKKVKFENPGTFANGTNYTLTDGTNQFIFRTDFYNMDYIGQQMPTSFFNVTGVIQQYNSDLQITARNLADFYVLSNDASLATFTLGGVNVLNLNGLEVTNPDTDAGATLFVDDFTDFAGIDIAATDDSATVAVSLNGASVDEADYATQVLADGDVVVVTVTAEDGTLGFYKVTITGENRTLTVTAPVGGETFYTGDDVNISWTSANIDSVNIYAEDATSHELYPIAQNIDATLGTYTYTIQNGDFGTVYFRVTDASDETFYANSAGTVTVIDNVSPDILSSYPADGAIDVPTSFTLSITFDEDVNPGAGNLEIYIASDSVLVIQKPVEEFTHNDDVLTIDISGLDYQTEYYITIPAGFVRDKSDNDNEAYGGANTWKFTTMAQPQMDLFFSEYIEGSSYNKAVEIYNPTSSPIDLSIYSLKKGTNGADFSTLFELKGTLYPGEVYVIAHAQAVDDIINVADTIDSGGKIVNFNGNDAIGLFKNDVLIDVIGKTDGDPGDGWPVAGINNATKDHTLVRKNNVVAGNTNWEVSAGTDAASSEWVVYGMDEFSYLGWHINKSSAKDILSIELAEQTGPAIIDNVNHTVTIEVIYGTDPSNLTPTIVVSRRATISPESGVAQNFTNPVTYTVTAQDESTQDWEVTVTVASALSNENDILSFEINGQLSSTINANAATVDVVMPYGTDLSSLTPTITVSAGATIDPASGVAQDFTNPVTYTVTAQDSSTKTWTVTVTVQDIPLTSIYSIQYTTDASGDSPLKGQQVRTKGIVTALKTGSTTFNMWLQDSAKAWNGVYVYGVNNSLGTVAQGDSVELIGTVDEYSNLTEIKTVTYLNKINSGNALPTPVEVIPAQAASEAYEGVLVRLSNVECTVADAGFGEFTVSDGTYTINVDDFLYKYTPTQGARYNITGVVDYSFGAFKLLPRSASDIESAATKYIVTFTVKRSDGTTAVDGATITVTGQGNVTTDASGVATMELPDGDYTYTVVKSGFDTKNGNFTVSGASINVDITLIQTGVPTNPIAKLSVYPNPFTDRIYFTGAEVTRVVITSVIGQVVLDRQVENSESIDVNSLERGIYLIRFYNSKGESVLRKLVKE